MVGPKKLISRQEQTLRIPFNRPYVSEKARGYVTQALDSGHQSGDGPFTRAATKALLNLIPAEHALLTPSCTHGLEMACILLDLKPGDEVIMPSFNFVSMANAVALRGATPVFVDVDSETLNLDASKIGEALNEKTRAIFVVHYAGVGANPEQINSLIDRSGLDVALVEDNAHGLGASWHGRPLGTFGTMSTQSFHETKNLQTGEGGALLINDASNMKSSKRTTDDLFERAEIIREKGTNRSKFFRGQVDKYTWVDIGSSWLPSDITAAFLLGQIEDFEKVQRRRHQIWSAYQAGLQRWAIEHGHHQPKVPEGAEHSAHIYFLLMNDAADQMALIAHLDSRDIHATFHYRPLHDSEMGRLVGRASGELTVTNEAADRIVRLPIWPDMTDNDVERVIDAVVTYRGTS